MIRPSFRVVSVGFPTAIPGIYDYSIPEEMADRIGEGSAVLVELRRTRMWGVVVQLKDRSSVAVLKPVLEVKHDQWARGSESLMALYRWVAGYYQCDIGRVFRPLVRKGLMESKPRTVWMYRVADAFADTLTPKQQEALAKVRALAQSVVSLPELTSRVGVSAHMAGALCAAGALIREQVAVVRQGAEVSQETSPGTTYELTGEQQAALDTMSASLDNPTVPYLLHGITGSGKTLVYIELARLALARGRGAIILVPEISLTPQTVGRFIAGIGDEVAVIHSRMSEGERRDSLEQLVTGKKRLVIGARSAVLAPIDNVGLIIVDEEHDQSYKQGEVDPRYQARDVAVMRGRLQKALVVLGSATPSLESHHNARTGKYALVTLQARFGAARLPQVEVVDMNVEHRDGNWTLMSRVLRRRIVQTIDSSRQVILLLNRRGFSVSLICKDCGHTYACPNCSVKLTYHRDGLMLKCHQCGYEEAAPQSCGKCRGEHIKYAGAGIQKAEEFLAAEFPTARVLRMDQDSTRRKGAHVSILDRFARHEADILLGTQMVAKGLDFAGVALVGVLNADVGLCLPDFRAGERTFQLLTQVAGRAGRGDALGEVVIQTYFPNECAIITARDHDFPAFAERELDTRRELGYPPFGRLARIIVEGPDEHRVSAHCQAVVALIRKLVGTRIEVLGPAPAAIARINLNHRYSILLKSSTGAALQSTLGAVRAATQKVPNGIRQVIDVDPVAML
jgi:primosomal protein N' (replication factor Y)